MDHERKELLAQKKEQLKIKQKRAEIQQYKDRLTKGAHAKGQQKTNFAHQRGRACGKSAGPSFCARQKRAKTAG